MIINLLEITNAFLSSFYHYAHRMNSFNIRPGSDIVMSLPNTKKILLSDGGYQHNVPNAKSFVKEKSLR